jgi:hypothetical protein
LAWRSVVAAGSDRCLLDRLAGGFDEVAGATPGSTAV